MAVAVLIQTAILVALFLGARRLQVLQVKLELLLEREIMPLLAEGHAALAESRAVTAEARTLVADGRAILATLGAAATDISGFTHTQTGRLNDLMEEAVERARMQLVRADQLIADGFTRVEKTAEQFQHTVSGPIREIQAILAGVRTAIEFLGGRRRPRGPVERSTADEELFI